MAIWTLKTLQEVSLVDVPDAHTLVERTSSDIFGIWGDSDSCDTVLDAEGHQGLTRLNIPEAHSPVTATGSNSPTIAGKIKRVNILLVASEGIANRSRLNVPYLLYRLVQSFKSAV